MHSDSPDRSSNEPDDGHRESADSATPPVERSKKIGFLVVTRRVSEGLLLGKDIHVIVNRVKDGQVRLAIYAPKDVPIATSTMADRRKGR